MFTIAANDSHGPTPRATALWACVGGRARLVLLLLGDGPLRMAEVHPHTAWAMRAVVDTCWHCEQPVPDRKPGDPCPHCGGDLSPF